MKTKHGLIYREKRKYKNGKTYYIFKAITNPDLNGKKKRSNFASYDKANIWLKSQSVDVEDGLDFNTSSRSLKYFIDQYMKSTKFAKLRQRTKEDKKRNYNQILKYFREDLGIKNIKMSELKYPILQRLMDLLAFKFSPRTVRDYRDNIFQIMKFAQRYGAVRDIPYLDVPENRKTNKDRTKEDKKRNYNQILKYFREDLGIKNIKMSELKYPILQRLMDLLAFKFSPRTVRDYRDNIFQIMKFAQRYGAVRDIPYLDVPENRKTNKDRIKDTDMNLFLQALNHRLSPAIWLLAYTGMRTGEVIALRWKDVNLSDGMIDINGSISKLDEKTFGRSSTKTGQNRVIKIFNKNAIEILREHFYKQTLELKNLGILQKEDNFIFTKLNGEIYHDGTLIREVIHKTCDKVGIKRFTNHTLRHNFASHLAEQGVTPQYVQYILGHSSIKTTYEVYVHTEMQKVSKGIKEIRIT